MTAIMAPKMPALHGTPANSNHTSGIYAAMDVDGPDIGTLVVVFDRAKNLPNLRTMGKQDPYCAARLGKEAKKTETDRRGGQTPRWDQELRFTVHDSPDYHKLKVSVFNDDKKTDLIGETWVGLEDVLRPGGGQGDSWHQLNIKGRYAGEIRIELTYYDTRPKAERPRKQANAALTQQDREQRSSMGPRQPVDRRPLPPSSGTPPSTTPITIPVERSGVIPSPSAGPRSYHTPPRQSVHQHTIALDSETQRPSTGSLEPEPEISSSTIQHHSSHLPHQNPFKRLEPNTENGFTDDFYYTDDVYALQAVEDMRNSGTVSYDQHDAELPRHERVQTLSGSPNVKPLASLGSQHLHPALQLAPHGLTLHHHQQQQQQQHHNLHYQDQRQSHPPQNYEAELSELSYVDQSRPLPVPSNSFGSAMYQPSDEAPPPPPLHRNSAPAIARQYGLQPSQQSTPPSRVLHIATSPADLSNAQNDNPRPRAGVSLSAGPSPVAKSIPHSQYPYSTPPRQTSVDGHDHYYQEQPILSYPTHLSRAADPMIQPRSELWHDPRQNFGDAAMLPENYNHRPLPLNTQRPQSFSYVGQSSATGYSYSVEHRPAPGQTIPIIKPRAISPSTRAVAPHTTPRKSVSPRSIPDHRPSENAYSPDSFNVLNPTHSNHSTPTFIDSKEPTPMYKPQEAPSRIVQPAPVQDGPIIGTDGRIKDPTDHLPPSSYAPEPERKGAEKHRPSTIINIKNRFGPREANASPPSTRPASLPPAGAYSVPPSEQRDRSYKRTSGAASSPLSPAHSNILNSSSGYNQNSPYPPPVPGKIPINGYQNDIDDYGPGGNMSSLATEIQNIDIGPNVPRNGAGRARKSRYAA